MASAPKRCELTFFRAVWSGLADWQRSMCMMMAPMVALACTGCDAQVRLLHRPGLLQSTEWCLGRERGSWAGERPTGRRWKGKSTAWLWLAVGQCRDHAHLPDGQHDGDDRGDQPPGN